MSEGASPPITGDDLKTWSRWRDPYTLAVVGRLIAALRAAERMAEAGQDWHDCATVGQDGKCAGCSWSAAYEAYRRLVSPLQGQSES